MLQWQPDGCGDKCANGSSCPHPSIGQSHPDQTDVSEWHEYAVEYSADTSTTRSMAKSSKRWRLTRDRKVRAFTHPPTNSAGMYNADSDVLAGQTPDFYDVPYYMILNTAVGGPWPGDPDPQTKFPLYHYIDYVHVAQPSGSQA